MRSKKWILVLIVSLVASNMWWLYTTVDNGVTVTHQSDQLGRDKDTIQLLCDLVRELPRTQTREEAVTWLKARYPERLVKMTDDTIEVQGDVNLIYEENTLKHVSAW